MLKPDFQYYFRHSSVAQWLVDIQLLYQLLLQMELTDAVQLESALDNNGALYARLREKLTVVDVNQTALQLHRCKDVAEIAEHVRHRLTDDELRHLSIAVLGMSDERSRYVYQTEVRFGDAHKVLLISCELPPLRDMVRGMHVCVMDITSLSDVEHELHERGQFLSAVLQAVPDILMVYDFQRQATIFQNIDLIKRLGYSDQDMADTGNRLLAYIIHPDDGLDRASLKAIYDTLASGSIYEVTIRLQHNNGDWRHYYFRSAALDKDEKGRVQSAVVIARDITDVLKTRHILSSQQQRYQLLADNFTDVILTTDTELKINYVSPSIQHCLGYEAETFIAMERPLALLGLSPEYRRLADKLDALPTRNDDDVHELDELLELEAKKADGTLLPVEVSISVLRDGYELLEGFLIIVRDISQRLKQEAADRLAAKVFANSLEGIYITDTNGVIAQANQAFYAITGFTEADVIGKKPSQLSSGWRDKNFRKDIKPILRSTGSWSGELMSRRASGEAFLIWMSICEVRDSRNQLVGMITSFRDITEAKSSEENIRKLAYYDPLTDLPNRQLLADRLSQALQRANRNRHYVALLFLDLDGFKDVNDTHGHAVGDILLKQVADRLKGCIRSDDTVARMGGDEFTIVLGALGDKDKAEKAAVQVSKKTIKKLNEAFVIQEKEIYIGTSIGIALYPDDAYTDELLVKAADTAMYHAKSAGKNGYQFYTEDMYRRTQKRLQTEKDIAAALHNNEFLLVFQPKLQVSDHRVCGFEALMRWQHPQQGLLTPNNFIRALDEVGMGSTVGEWVIDEACRHLAQSDLCSVSVNIFSKQYRDGDLVESVAASLQKHAIAPERLVLEISEHLVMADTGYAYAIISELKVLGVRIALDDFASGMLSIPYLARLPVDEVKIDRQFIEYIDKGAAQWQLVGSMIALAKSLGLVVTAEGIERKQQLKLLEKAGCDRVQGFLFSKPAFLHELDAYLAKQ